MNIWGAWHQSGAYWYSWRTYTHLRTPFVTHFGSIRFQRKCYGEQLKKTLFGRQTRKENNVEKTSDWTRCDLKLYVHKYLYSYNMLIKDNTFTLLSVVTAVTPLMLYSFNRACFFRMNLLNNIWMANEGWSSVC